MSDTVTVFKDEKGEWRWQRQAENGEIVATSGEGYLHRSHAEHMAREVFLGQEDLILVIVSET